MEDTELNVLKEKAALWDKHKNAIVTANSIIQSCRPLLLNLMVLEQANDAVTKEAKNYGLR